MLAMLTMLGLGKSDHDMEVIFVRFARWSANIANVTNRYCLQYIVHIKCLQKYQFYVRLLSNLIIQIINYKTSNLVTITLSYKLIILKHV